MKGREEGKRKNFRIKRTNILKILYKILEYDIINTNRGKKLNNITSEEILEYCFNDPEDNILSENRVERVLNYNLKVYLNRVSICKI